MKTFLFCLFCWVALSLTGLGICVYFSLTPIPQVLLGWSLGAVGVLVCNWKIDQEVL